MRNRNPGLRLLEQGVGTNFEHLIEFATTTEERRKGVRESLDESLVTTLIPRAAKAKACEEGLPNYVT